ncbi:MAG TPA: hypothetical protein VNO43_14720 [Candidatus Eisenbacteria bacterium]|nr:hypothetical protein [Candidatus Eisenbacteria bacterium]
MALNPGDPVFELGENSAVKSAHYSKTLRAIGCALDALRVEEFDLTSDGPNYVVQVKSQRKKPQGVRTVLHRIFHRLSQNSASGLQLIYTPKEIDWLDHEAQLMREETGSPDPHSLPQALRSIGAYLEVKGARLLKISGRSGVFNVSYESAQHGRHTEDFTPAALYEWFVKGYLKRSSRINRSDPIASITFG